MAVEESGTLVSQDSRTISGYAAVFGNVDMARDLIVRGAFAKSISERGVNSTTNRKIAFLWQHDMSEPLGKLTKLEEDEKGLYFEAVLDKIPEGDRALEQMKSGTLNQFSIGYQYVWDKTEYDENLEAFILKEINLFEISVVTIGCNELTGFTGMKAEQLESEGNKLTRETEKALKTLPKEQEYQFRQLISKHIALAETKPPTALKQPEPPAFDVIEAIQKTKFIN